MKKFKAVLFDLDGVVFDTEPQYTQFWGQQCKEFRSDIPGLEFMIKGQTLVQIFEKYFNDEYFCHREVIVKRLEEFEKTMTFDYVDGFENFISQLKEEGIKTAVVTSSNCAKMSFVYQQREEFKGYFDAILTSEDFEYSKPHPDCYEKASKYLGIEVDKCVVFEDSFNGLKSGRAANMCVVGITTTNSREAIEPLADFVIDNYNGFSLELL